MLSLKKNKNIWTLELTSKKRIINDAEEFAANLKVILDTVQKGKEEFIILSPETPIDKIIFLQACRDKGSGLLHIETGLEEENVNGHNKIFYKDNVSIDEVANIFLEFFQNEKININGWDELDW